MAKSMSYNQAAGLSTLLKPNQTHITNNTSNNPTSTESATLRNIEAAKSLSTIVSTSLGPHGMNKLVVTHLEKIIITSDCATIVRELEIEHPAAKMLQLAAEMQDKECGDGTNLTVSFAGELLGLTEDLLRMGLHASEIIGGYKRAGEKLLELLPGLTCRKLESGRDVKELTKIIRPVVGAKQYGSQDVLAPLVAKACLGTMNYAGRPVIHAESVRVAKILGGRVEDSEVIHGFVHMKGAEGVLKEARDARITVFGCAVEASGTEAKGTVLMKNAEDLKGYNKTEEQKMEEVVKSIADTGTKVIVSGGPISEMAQHFIERYDMMAIKISSKFELRRLCSAVNATALVRLGPATADEMGFCDSVAVREVGGKNITVFSQNKSVKDGCRLSTILLRASTSGVLQDMERAIEDGVHAARVACNKDPRVVPGGGATEMDLAVKIKAFGDTCPGLDQYAVRAFAKALEFVPRTLAQNAGLDAVDVMAVLGTMHAEGKVRMGVDVEGDTTKNGAGGVKDVVEDGICDLLSTKTSAFRLAIDAALTVLRVDQIIMSKPSGGPKPR